MTVADLVARLRAHAKIDDGPPMLMLEAADELERLDVIATRDMEIQRLWAKNTRMRLLLMRAAEAMAWPDREDRVALIQEMKEAVK